MRNMISKYLEFYDRQPAIALALGFPGLFLTFALFAWTYNVFIQVFSYNQAFSFAVVFVPMCVITFMPMLVLLSLGAELMWRVFFVSRVFKIEGQPIRDGLGDFSK
ncbi:MAG: hypothetical protein GY717_00325 [Rhodobacteraceae bacterium]|nr:hypothetical protein [Paracoccaceae bacterium]